MWQSELWECVGLAEWRQRSILKVYGAIQRKDEERLLNKIVGSEI